MWSLQTIVRNSIISTHTHLKFLISESKLKHGVPWTVMEGAQGHFKVLIITFLYQNISSFEHASPERPPLHTAQLFIIWGERTPSRTRWEEKEEEKDRLTCALIKQLINTRRKKKELASLNWISHAHIHKPTGKHKLCMCVYVCLCP